MSVEIYVHSGNCPVGHMSGRANFYQNSIRVLTSGQFTVRLNYCPVGLLSVGLVSIDLLSAVDVSSGKCPVKLLSRYRSMEQQSQNNINLFLHSINASYLEIIIKLPFLPLFTNFPISLKPYFSFSNPAKTLNSELYIEMPLKTAKILCKTTWKFGGSFRINHISLCILPPSKYSHLIINSFKGKEKYLIGFRE